MDTCAIDRRKQKYSSKTKKSIYNQQNFCSRKGLENWSAIIICSFYWIILCCRLLFKKLSQVSVECFSQYLSLLLMWKNRITSYALQHLNLLIFKWFWPWGSPFWPRMGVSGFILIQTNCWFLSLDHKKIDSLNPIASPNHVFQTDLIFFLSSGYSVQL